MFEKLKEFWAEAVILQRIVFKLMKKLPVKLALALLDGKLSSKEVKDLISLVTETITQELIAIADENLNDLNGVK